MCFIDLVETRNKSRDFYFSFIFRYDKILSYDILYDNCLLLSNQVNN